MKASERLEEMLAHAQSFLLSIRVARLSLGILLTGGLTVFACYWGIREAPGLVPSLLVAGFIATVILVAIHEVWTARYVSNRSLAFAERVALPVWYYFKIVQTPARILSNLIDSMATGDSEDAGSPHQTIMTVVRDPDHSKLKEAGREMIHSIVEFSDTDVREIMVPRTDMVCINETDSLATLRRLVKEKGHSRIPLFREDIDNVLGLIHVKDLLNYDAKGKGGEPKLNDLARPAYFVPESKQLPDLLKEFKKEKYHMAIVLDEYGGTAGLVTLEDVIEEIVGDIQDEYDREAPLIRKIDERHFAINAKIDLHELNESLQIDLPTEGDYETLGGFILSLTGYVPEEKETVPFANYRFTVEKLDRNRIVNVRLSVDSMPVGDPHSENGA